MNLKPLWWAALVAVAALGAACEDPVDANDAGIVDVADDAGGDTGPDADIQDVDDSWKDVSVDAEGIEVNVPRDEEAILFAAIGRDHVDANGGIESGKSFLVQIFKANPADLTVAPVQQTPYVLDRKPTDSHEGAARSPDRKKIVFVSGEERAPSDSADNPYKGSLYVMNHDGTDKKRLTASPIPTCHEFFPVIVNDPDATNTSKYMVTFMRSCSATFMYGDVKIPGNHEYMFRINIDGTKEKPIVTNIVDSVIGGGVMQSVHLGTPSRDGKYMYGFIDSGGAGSKLVRTDIATYATTLIKDFSKGTTKGFVQWPLSLDGNGDIYYTVRYETPVTGGTESVGKFEKMDLGGNITTLRNIDHRSAGGFMELRSIVSPSGDKMVYFKCTAPETWGCSNYQLERSKLDGSEVEVFAGQGYMGPREMTWNN